MFQLDWFRRLHLNDPEICFDQVVQSWDTANKVNERADDSVCTTWGIKSRTLYLLHVFRRKLDYPDLRRAVISRRDAHRPNVILIEDKASGTQIIQDLISAGVSNIVKMVPQRRQGDARQHPDGDH